MKQITKIHHFKIIKVGSDFSGVGAFNQALKRLGVEYDEIFACDMDKYARQTFIHNYGEPKYYPTNVYDRQMEATDQETSASWSWIASDGLPFIIKVGNDNNSRVISFRCVMPHGLSVGDSVYLSFDYNGEYFLYGPNLELYNCCYREKHNGICNHEKCFLM